MKKICIGTLAGCLAAAALCVAAGEMVLLFPLALLAGGMAWTWWRERHGE